jgi:uncharacterized protein (TIGR03437 family)
MKPKLSWKRIAVLGLAATRMLTAQTSTIASDDAPRADLVPRATAGPGIIPIGSSLTFGGTNAPDTYSATTTFSSTPVLVDNGAVKIWQNQVPTSSSGEWDIFYMQTTSGGPLAGNINANWNIVMNYTLSAPVVFDAVVQQWGVNGTPISPITNGIGSICCAAVSNPILPGASYYNSGFSSPLPAGVFMNWQQVFVDPYNFVQAGGINPSTANTFTFALHFTLQPAGPTVTGAISASQFGGFPTFGPGSWIEIYGTNLGVGPQTWGTSDFSGVNAPTKLAGTSVSIGGQAAFVEYVSPGQIDVQVPAGVGTGPQSLTVTTGSGSSPPFGVTIGAQPGLLAPPSFNIGGTQYVVALFSDGVTYVLPPGAIPGVASRRAKPGDTIMLYGVGFGPVNTFIPPGQIAQGQSMLAANFTLSFGGSQASVSYDGLVATYVGLYQFNVVVPNVAANDAVPLTFNLGGTNGTQKLSIAVGN